LGLGALDRLIRVDGELLSCGLRQALVKRRPDDDRRIQHLGFALEARREVHRGTEHRELALPFPANVADEDLTRVEPHADPNRFPAVGHRCGNRDHFLSTGEGLRHRIALTRSEPPDGHHGIADKLVH
jgi:hypothetical protein